MHYNRSEFPIHTYKFNLKKVLICDVKIQIIIVSAVKDKKFPNTPQEFQP